MLPKREGIRIVYKLIRTESKMLVVVIGMSEDDELYEIAQSRIKSMICDFALVLDTVNKDFERKQLHF